MEYLIDSHCHLADLTYDNTRTVDAVLARARVCGVTHFLTVACSTKDFAKNLEIAKDRDNIYIACGVHPLNLEDDPNWSEDDLKQILENKKVLALGECGLDYHYARETRELQLKSFERQLELAVELKKPLVIHAREAHKDTLSLLRGTNARDCGGVIHCFTDSVDMARECLDLGFYISFTGISTFKASDNVREVVKYVPLDRMMVETDCPYLAPIPVRGKENEPCYVRYTLKFIADFLNIKESMLAAISSQNFQDLYKIKLLDPPAIDGNADLYKIEKIANTPFER